MIKRLVVSIVRIWKNKTQTSKTKQNTLKEFFETKTQFTKNFTFDITVKCQYFLNGMESHFFAKLNDFHENSRTSREKLKRNFSKINFSGIVRIDKPVKKCTHLGNEARKDLTQSIGPKHDGHFTFDLALH